MSELTRILEAIERGDRQAADALLPLVYDELRQLAARMMAHERPGQTLQPTALVHEAYMRLVAQPVRRCGEPTESSATPTRDADAANPPAFANRRHFFAAAAEAMRRILVENARRKGRQKHGGGWQRREFHEEQLVAPSPPHEMLAIHDALNALEQTNQQAAELVKLRYFAGLTIPEAAEILAISPRKANQVWAYARAWLLDQLATDREEPQ